MRRNPSFRSGRQQSFVTQLDEVAPLRVVSNDQHVISDGHVQVVRSDSSEVCNHFRDGPSGERASFALNNKIRKFTHTEVPAFVQAHTQKNMLTSG